MSLTFDYPCAIKGCTKFTRLARVLEADQFVVCGSCENAIFLNLFNRMAKQGLVTADKPREMAALLKAFRRGNRGLGISTQPSEIGS